MSDGHLRLLRSFRQRLVNLSTTTCTAWLSVATITVAENEAQPGEPINQLCPVMPEEPVETRFTLEFKGRTIGFCCKKCVARFQANPDRYRARLPQFAAANGGSDEGRVADKAPTDGIAVGTAPNPVELFGRYHPVLVHLPIAGMPLALIGLCSWLVTKKSAFAGADAPPLLVGGAISIAAVVTGNIAEGSASFSPFLQNYLRWHEYAGTVLMALAIALCVLRIWRWRCLSGAWLGLYAGGLVIASVVVGISGFFGGTLVLGTGHLWP